MAGIYIPGMEMPIGHNEATFGIDVDGHPLLAVYTENNPEPEIYYITLVPDHGRLKDTDALYEKFMSAPPAQFTLKEVAIMIDWEEIAPTIIPADLAVENGGTSDIDEDRLAEL